MTIAPRSYPRYQASTLKSMGCLWLHLASRPSTKSRGRYHQKVSNRNLAYPKARWVREGSPPFHARGEMTDGPGTLWMEFYDVDKMLRLFEPARVELLFEYEWHNKFQLG